MQSTWEDAHSAALREYLDKGLPFSEIARALNQRFGTTYSRNAAIGRARRMGLSVPIQKRHPRHQEAGCAADLRIARPKADGDDRQALHVRTRRRASIALRGDHA